MNQEIFYYIYNKKFYVNKQHDKKRIKQLHIIQKARKQIEYR